MKNNVTDRLAQLASKEKELRETLEEVSPGSPIWNDTVSRIRSIEWERGVLRAPELNNRQAANTMRPRNAYNHSYNSQPNPHEIY
jgi:hypothetical protein